MSIHEFQWTGKHNLINRVFFMLDQKQSEYSIYQYIKTDLFRHSNYHRHLNMVKDGQALNLDDICEEIIQLAKGE